MSKLEVTLAAFVIPLILLFASADLASPNSAKRKNENGETGTLQKMIVENADVTMQFDLNGLNGSGSLVARPVTLHFVAAANSFFPIAVFNDLLRGIEPGSMALAWQDSSSDGVNAPGYNLPAPLKTSLKRLTLEKLQLGQKFDLAVRDSSTGFTFFNIEGHQYDYDAKAQLLGITGGRLLISKELASALGRPSEAGAVVGKISVGAAMQPIEINQLVNGELKSLAMPPLRGAVAGANSPDLVPGPDVIVGDIEDIEEPGNTESQVGLDVGTDSCNNGDQPVDWFALPSNDHPVVPQNLYRMSGGPDNQERFEQVGQSWMKHTFEALEESVCNTCNTNGCQTGTHLCPSCSDPYCCGLNGDQDLLGSRAWVNPFTGNYPPGNPPPGPNDHNGHNHDSVSHRIRVNITDLNQSLNQGSSYFAEAAYIAPSEYTWCQSHPGECNMYNNVSYRQFSVSGTTPPFSFGAIGSTVRMQPAIMAWAGATVNQVQPDPGNDGIWFMGYKVTNPSQGVWHYEYALYNENLDRAIQSFSVPLGAGVNISNIDFHAPPQEPGWANDGTFMNQGYSSTPWAVTQASDSISWASETFAQNQNANAVRFGTLYNFRFDSDQAPHTTTATVGFFKTGSPIPVVIEAPVLADATPTPTPTASPSITPTPTPTPTPTATPTGCDSGLIQNGGFETGSFSPWVIDGTLDTPLVTNTLAHTGTFSAIALSVTSQPYCGSGAEALGDSSFYQQFGPVPAGATLSFWYNTCTTDSITFDWQDAYITDSNGNILQTIFHQCTDNSAWVNQTVDMSAYAGQTVRIKFLVHGDAFGDLTAMYVDDVALYVPCGTPTASPTPTATPTATATATATAAATATATATATPTPTSTPRPTLTPRIEPTPRTRPTPPPRP